MRHLATGLALVLFLLGTTVRADIIVQSDFQGGTVDGWNQPFSASAVEVVADSGPGGVGDFSIRSIPHPTFQQVFPQNSSTAGFVGNYVTSGAFAVSFDYRGVGTLPAGMELYVVMLNSAANRWVSVGSVVPTTSWQNATISILEPDLVHPLGNNSWATDFANISQIGFRFQQNANQSGGSDIGTTSYDLYLDNIQLLSIPEPGCGMAIMLALPALLLRRRRTC